MTLSKVKQDLIAEIEQRVEDHVLETSNAELLNKLIAQADNDNEAISIAALGTTYKRTGLHFDKRLERLTHDIRYFRKNEALSFHTDDDKPTHKLIIGDNYEALQNLLVQYSGAIDVIYIDPPYGKDSMGEFAQTNYQNAITRDNLLSMLYPRLQLAKQLLSDSGVIFCSIDDKNQAYVKCLFDEVFGESSFIATVIWQKRKGGGNDSVYVGTDHEYILAYVKKKELNPSKWRVSYDEDYLKRYKFLDEQGYYYYDTLSRPGLNNPIIYDVVCPDGTVIKNGTWQISKDTFDTGLKTGDVIFVKNKEGGFTVMRKVRVPEEGKVFRSIITNVSNKDAADDMESLFGVKKAFSNPKPVGLIRQLIDLPKISENSIILDFFAGSGTTGHAVLDLNRSEEKEGDLFAETNTGGNRTFILCQMNEITDTTPNGIAYDVTAKRLKRIMTGECYDGTKDFEWIKKNKPYGGNLDVYEIDKVADFEYTEGKSPFDVINETLYGLPRFATLQEKIDWVCTHFSNTRKQLD